MWVSISKRTKKFKPADWWLRLSPAQQQAYVNARQNTKYRDLVSDIDEDLGDVPKMANTGKQRNKRTPEPEELEDDIEDQENDDSVEEDVEESADDDDDSVEEDDIEDQENDDSENSDYVQEENNEGHPGLDENGDPNEHIEPLQDGHNYVHDRDRIPPASNPEELPPHVQNELMPRRNPPPPAPIPPNNLDNADDDAIDGEYERVPNNRIIEGIKKAFGNVYDSYKGAIGDTANYIRSGLPDTRTNQEIQDDGTLSDSEKTQKLNDRKKIVASLATVLVGIAAASFLGPGAATFALVMGLEYAEGYCKWLDEQTEDNLGQERPSTDPRVSGETTVNGTRYINIVVNGRLQRRLASDYEEYIDSDGFKKVRRIDGSRESLSANVTTDQDLNVIINSFKKYMSTLNIKQNMIDFRNSYENKR